MPDGVNLGVFDSPQSSGASAFQANKPKKPDKPKASRSYAKPKSPINDVFRPPAREEPQESRPKVGEGERQFFGAVAKGTPSLARGFSPEVKESVAQDAGGLSPEAQRGLIAPESGMPDYVRKNILKRVAASSVPAHLQNPANWPESYKQKLLDPNSDDAKIAARDTEHYGMPTFGYVSDPDRDQFVKQLKLSRRPGNVYSEAKSMDEHLANASVDLPDDVRHAAIGYMWLKNQMHKDDDPVALGTGYTLANQLSNPDNWDSFKQSVAQMKDQRDALLSRPELAFLTPDMRAPTETMRRQRDPRTIEGQGALYDLAHGDRLTFGHDQTPERAQFIEEAKSRLGRDALLEPGIASGMAANEATKAGTTMKGVNERAEALGLMGTRPQGTAPFLEQGQSDWVYRTASGAVEPVPHEKGNVLSGMAGALGQVGAWSLQGAANLGILPATGILGSLAQQEIGAHGARPGQSWTEFEKGYQESVSGTVGSIGAHFAPYMIPGFGQAAFGSHLLQMTLDEGPSGFWKGTGVPDALRALDDPQSTWQQRTESVAALAAAGLMLFHAGSRIGKRYALPVDVPPDVLHQEWLDMPPDVLAQAIRIRTEIIDALQQAGATAPRNLDAHATAAATYVARAARNFDEAQAASLLENVRYTFDNGLSVPAELEATLGTVAAQINAEPEAMPQATGPVPTASGVSLGATHFWTPNLGKLTATYEIVPLESLKASHDSSTFAENPNYPSELQPRDRTREANRISVGKITAKFDHERALDEHRSMTEGAPIVMPDGTVVSGNGRVMALEQLARGEGNQKAWQDYRLRLKNMGAEGIKDPVLIRRVPQLEPADARLLAEEGNRSAASAMSPVEEATSDAGRLPDNFWESLEESGNSIDSTLNSRKNRELVTRFLQSVPEAERGRLVTSDGALSTEGLLRIKRAAVLDLLGPEGSLTAERMFETGEESARLANGFFRATPQLLKVKSQELADVLNTVFTEFDRFRKFQDEGYGNWETYKAQESMAPLDPEVKAVVDQIGDAATTGGSAAKVADVFTALAESGKFRDIAAKLAGQESLWSGQRGKGGYVVARLMVPGFRDLVSQHGAKDIGNGYFAVPDTPEGHMLLDQAGMQIDRVRTRDFGRRNLDQEGLFGEPATTATVATPPEPGQDTLFSGLKEGETYSVNAMHTWNPALRTGLIQLGPGATIAEVAHETAHYIRRILPEETLATVADSLGIKGWDLAAEERFARAFELYLTEKGSTPGLDPVMARLALAVRDVYAGEKGQPGIREHVKGQIGREPTPEDMLKFHAEPTIGEGELTVPDSLKGIFDEMTKRPESWPGMTAAIAAKEKEDAVPEQSPDESVLREEGSQVGLQEVVEGNARPEESAGEEGKPPVQQAEVESPFGEDVPHEKPMEPHVAKATAHFEGKGMEPALAEKAARGIFGDAGARQALVSDKAAMDALVGHYGLNTSVSPELAGSLLDRIGEMTAKREGFKWKPANAPEEETPPPYDFTSTYPPIKDVPAHAREDWLVRTFGEHDPPDAEGIAAIHEEQFNELSGYLDDQHAIEHALESGLKPNGKTLTPKQIEAYREDLVHVKQQYQGALEAYADGFGDEAAAKFDAHVREAASTDVKEGRKALLTSPPLEGLPSGERRIPGLKDSELDAEIEDVLTPEEQMSPGWRGPLKKLKDVKSDLGTAASRFLTGIVSELGREGGKGRDAADKIYNAWAFGRKLSAEYRYRLYDAIDTVYGRAAKTHKAGEVADTEAAILERWDSKERMKVLQMDSGAFEDWLTLAGKPKPAADGLIPPTLDQIKLWHEWGKLAEETAQTAWSRGVGVWRVAGPDLGEVDSLLHGREVRFVTGGKKDSPGVMQSGKWVGWDEGKNQGLILGEDGQLHTVNTGDTFTTASLIKGMEFFPRVLTESARKGLSDPNSPMYRQEVARRMKSGMTKEQAQSMIKSSLEPVVIQIPGRALTRIERPRLPSDFPPEFYEHDFKRVAEHHLDSVGKRVAQAQFMGPDMAEVAADLAEASNGNDALLKHWGESIQSALGHNRMNDRASNRWREAASAYAAVKTATLLGTGKTAIKQLGSLASVAGVHGYGPTLRALPAMLTPSWYETMHRLGVLDSDYAMMHGVDFTGKMKDVAGAVLKATGVTQLDLMTRGNGSMAGVIATKLAVIRLARVPETRWTNSAHYRYLHEWGKFSNAEIGKMVQRAQANGGHFDFTMDGMEPMFTKAAFSGVQSVGITDPINFPKAVNDVPPIKSLFTLNNFYYLQSKVFGYAMNEAAQGNVVPLFRMITASTLVGGAVMAGIQKLDKVKQDGFWYGYYRLGKGESHEDAWEHAQNASGSRAEQPGYRDIGDVDWNDWASGGTLKQIAAAAADGLDITGTLGSYGGFLDAVRPDNTPFERSARDRIDSALTGIAPVGVKDIVTPFAQLGASLEAQKSESDRLAKGGKPPTTPKPGFVEDVFKGTAEQVAPIPVIGSGPYRKPAAWKLAMTSLTPENAKLARRYGAYPEPKPRKGEDPEGFLARVKAQAANWNAILDNVRAQGLQGEKLRGEVLRSVKKAFTQASRSYSQ